MNPDEQLKYLKEAERLEIELAKLKSGVGHLSGSNSEPLVEAFTRQLERVDRIIKEPSSKPAGVTESVALKLTWFGTARDWGDWVLRAHKKGGMWGRPDDKMKTVLRLAGNEFLWQDPRHPNKPPQPFNIDAVYKSLKKRDDERENEEDDENAMNPDLR
jgi:hypothetical protein